MRDQFGAHIACGNTAYERKESDFYPTPPEVTIALLNSPAAGLFIGATVWEPACGEGHMSKVLKKHQPLVVSSDLSENCYGRGGVDFLKSTTREADWIVTNPPFNLSEQFIRKGIELGGNFAYLLKSQYWHASRRYDLFCEYPPAYVLPLTWRPDFLFKTRGGGSPLMDVLWCVWTDGTTVPKYLPLKRPRSDE